MGRDPWGTPRPGPPKISRGLRGERPQLPSGSRPAPDDPKHTSNARVSPTPHPGPAISGKATPFSPESPGSPSATLTRHADRHTSQRPRLEDSEFYSKPYCTDLGVQGLQPGWVPRLPLAGVPPPVPQAAPHHQASLQPQPPSLLPLVRPAPAPNPRTFLLPEVCG